MIAAPIIRGKNLVLRPLVLGDASDDCLSWLNDPEVNRYSRRAGRTESMDGLKAWLGQESDALRLAIMLGSRHIGGISLSADAEISIMIGARDCWGRGYATEAILLLADYALIDLGLPRVWAESPSPAFNAAMRKLKWTHEGTRENAVNGLDVECWAIHGRLS